MALDGTGNLIPPPFRGPVVSSIVSVVSDGVSCFIHHDCSHTPPGPKGPSAHSTTLSSATHTDTEHAPSSSSFMATQSTNAGSPAGPTIATPFSASSTPYTSDDTKPTTDSTPVPPSGTFTPPSISAPSAASPSVLTAAVSASALASPKSGAGGKSKTTPIIVGVLVPAVVLLLLGATAYLIFKRRQRARARDRREWERTHAEIAEVVRQVGGPATIAVPVWGAADVGEAYKARGYGGVDEREGDPLFDSEKASVAGFSSRSPPSRFLP
ncbi:hypothetical protein C8R46DRAFT_1345245 [Mycena filopes]|nr:hypothetical protein C8R46DRAFT_1345245 [Mycena filopes]